VSGYSVADITIGATPHNQQSVPLSLSQPQEGKILSGLRRGWSPKTNHGFSGSLGIKRGLWSNTRL